MSDIITLVTILLSAIVSLISPVAPDSEPTAESVVAEVVQVIDGDTIDVRFANGREERVRYIGVDTPEPYRDGEPACYSSEATDFNMKLVDNQTVTLVADQEDKDRFDRLLRYVYVDEVFVNAELIKQGYAKTLPIKPNTKYAREFRDYEKEAAASGSGLWSACN